MRNILSSLLFILVIFMLPAQAVSDLTVSDAGLGAMETRTKPENPSLTKSENTDRIKRMIDKADGYFDKMWYAEASELYDKVLLDNPEMASPELLQKAGDSHYFNSNMKMANKWYEQLYKNYKDEVDKNTLFNYSHSLKGVGRRGKARRMMRLSEQRAATNESLASLTPEKAKTVMAFRNAPPIELRNLENNSIYSDFSPIYLANGKLAFTSARDSSFFSTNLYKWNDQPYLDLYTGTVDSERPEKLDNIEKLDKNINSKYHEAAMAMTADGNTLYFTRNNYLKKLKRDEEGVNHLKLYKSVKKDGKWTKAIELSLSSDDYSTGHPALSSDGTKLYFVSDMPGGFGATDIYVVDINADGSFSTPKNLGRSINSDAREMFPFITDNTLYFSSDRALGIGGLDIYGSSYSGEDFDMAVNMATPINSKKDDFSYIVDKTMAAGYFASNRKGGKGSDDIYYFKQLAPEPDMLASSIIGVVFEKMTGRVISNASIQLFDHTNTLIAEDESDAFGNFEFPGLKLDSKYMLRVDKAQYKEKVMTLETEGLRELSANLLLERVEGKEPIAETTEKTFVDSGSKNPAGQEEDAIAENASKNPAGKEEDALAENASKNPARQEEDALAESTSKNPAGQEEDALAESTSKNPAGQEEDALAENASKNPAEEEIEIKDYALYEAQPIYFDFERYSLSKASKAELDRLAMALKENQNMTVKIESHTDSRGTRAFNKWLSQERANATYDYLVLSGVDEKQIESAIGYGEDQPINECGNGIRCSSESHKKNRRSEFIITGK